MRSVVMAIAISFFAGVLYTADWHTLCCDVWHEYFSGCRSVSHRKEGEQWLRSHPLRGMTTDQVVRLLGKPDLIKTYRFIWTNFEGREMPLILPDDSDSYDRFCPHEMPIWLYRRQHIYLEFRDNTCAETYGCPDACPHLRSH